MADRDTSKGRASTAELPSTRRSERRPVIAFVWFHLIGGADCEGVARSCDVSREGLGIVSSRPMPTGEALFVEIAGKHENVSLVGRIMHCCKLDDTGYRVGVQVEIVPPNDRPTLARMSSE